MPTIRAATVASQAMRRMTLGVDEEADVMEVSSVLTLSAAGPTGKNHAQ